MKRTAIVLFAAFLVAALAVAPLAAEVECDATYCFTAQDFSEEEQVAGICITQLPDPSAGTVMLGSRVLRSGDILAADQLAQMTFLPLRTEEDTSATVTYLPIYENRVAPAATMTISIRGKEDKAPVAEDLAIETYKNLPNDGILKTSDPEGQAMIYTVIRAPRRGQVTIREDGTFTYTPKKNKVGVDSFVYTATDSSGNVSREATVTVQILKPSDARQYADTVGQNCRFEAEWLRHTGLFAGENISGQNCFFPEQNVSRGEFVAMLIEVLQIAPEEADYSQIPADVPVWLKPYVGAAMRAGLLEGLQTETFDAQSPITGAEAAVMVQNALELTVTETAAIEDETVPAWAADSVAVLAENGINLNWSDMMTRGDTAILMYRLHALAATAPGMMILR